MALTLDDYVRTNLERLKRRATYACVAAKDGDVSAD